jgi:hypothetical protein
MLFFLGLGGCANYSSIEKKEPKVEVYGEAVFYTQKQF